MSIEEGKNGSAQGSPAATRGPTRAAPQPHILLEIEVALSGDVARYRPATHWDPAEGGEVEDLDIVGIATDVALPRVWTSVGPAPREYQSVNLLDGVDLKSPAIQRLFTNILEAHRREAEQAIVDDQLARAA